ncbi:hypothetical protein [Nocardia gipuzkoensis]|uniref:hypothetical protein n=1 Tax=Nocardia gipuzkoensis TaxID=2749991 RepID=UPI003EE405EC
MKFDVCSRGAGGVKSGSGVSFDSSAVMTGSRGGVKPICAEGCGSGAACTGSRGISGKRVPFREPASARESLFRAAGAGSPASRSGWRAFDRLAPPRAERAAAAESFAAGASPDSSRSTRASMPERSRLAWEAHASSAANRASMLCSSGTAGVLSIRAATASSFALTSRRVDAILDNIAPIDSPVC